MASAQALKRAALAAAVVCLVVDNVRLRRRVASSEARFEKVRHAAAQSLRGNLEREVRWMRERLRAERRREPGERAAACAGRVAALDRALSASRLGAPGLTPLSKVTLRLQRAQFPEPVVGPVSTMYAWLSTSPNEVGTEQVLRRFLRPRCADPPGGEAPLMIEAGTNEGSWGLLAAHWGCRVVSFEPQPQCVADLSLAVAAASSRYTNTIHNAFVSDANFTVTVPYGECVGTAQFTAAGITDKYNDDLHKRMRGWKPHWWWRTPRLTGSAIRDFSVETEWNRSVSVPSVRLDSVVREDVFLLKIDVEGAEIAVLRSASRLLRDRTVRHLVIELSRRSWGRFSVAWDEGVRVMREAVRQQGYRGCWDLRRLDRPPVPLLDNATWWQDPATDEIELWCSKERWQARHGAGD